MWTQSNRNQYHRGTNFDKKYIHKEPSIIHSYGIPNSACYSRKMACLIGSLKKEPPTNNTVASGDRKEEGKCVHLYWFYWCQAGSVGYTIWHEHFARLADPTPPFTRNTRRFPGGNKNSPTSRTWWHVFLCLVFISQTWHRPAPHPIICIIESEAELTSACAWGLIWQLLSVLTWREHGSGKKDGIQEKGNEEVWVGGRRAMEKAFGGPWKRHLPESKLKG